MKTKYFILFLLAFNPLRALEPGSAKPDFVRTPPESAAFFIRGISDIFRVIERESPVLAQSILEDEKMKPGALELFISSLNRGIRYIPPGDKWKRGGKALKDSSGEICGLVNIASNKITYIRIDFFGENTFTRLKPLCQMASRLKPAAKGLIIDLRDCSGHDFETMLECLKLFCPADKIPEPNKKNQQKRLFDLPAVVLLSRKTSGAAELFAGYLTAAGAISIGGKTAGNPFPGKSFRLETGGTLVLPLIPGFIKKPLFVPFEPSIKEKALPMMDFKVLSREKSAEEKDECILKAVDLLISIDTLYGKHHNT